MAVNHTFTATSVRVNWAPFSVSMEGRFNLNNGGLKANGSLHALADPDYQGRFHGGPDKPAVFIATIGTGTSVEALAQVVLAADSVELRFSSLVDLKLGGPAGGNVESIDDVDLIVRRVYQ